MTYVAAVIVDNPQNYWRLNEGPGAAAALDYGNQPGMLWSSYGTVSGDALLGFSGFGWGGITADGGGFAPGAGGLWNRVATPASAANPYTPLPDPGALELWFFAEQADSFVYAGWHAPAAPTNQQLWGLECSDQSITVRLLTFAGVTLPVSQLGIWHHVAMSWGSGTGITYLDGAQATPFSYTGSVAGSHVSFLLGDNQATPTGQHVSGLVTEVATYRRLMSGAQFATHRTQAELLEQRPHWLGPRTAVSNTPVTINRNYRLGVKHVARSGDGSFVLPLGLRGVQIDIIEPFPPSRVSPGTPPYLWDVGWVSLLDPNGMVAEVRPNRDTRIWMPDGAELCNVFTHNLLPGWTIDVTELDPA